MGFHWLLQDFAEPLICKGAFLTKSGMSMQCFSVYLAIQSCISLCHLHLCLGEGWSKTFIHQGKGMGNPYCWLGNICIPTLFPPAIFWVCLWKAAPTFCLSKGLLMDKLFSICKGLGGHKQLPIKD